MIVITGAAGFIGSNMISTLAGAGYTDLVAVDEYSRPDKMKNLNGKQLREKVEREQLFEWIDQNHRHIQFIIHIGARTDTAEFDTKVFDKLNLNYSKKLWQQCCKYGLPMIYASSAATYGMGEHGFDDTHDIIPRLKPLNPYGESKNEFDKWAIGQPESPFYWAGLKFFNVYGPNEYHKGRMASVIFHTSRQIDETGKMKLFRSHHVDYEDGKQLRDFIYVKDVCNVMLHLMENRPQNGIFNLGTGQARSFLDLARGTFRALGLEENIEFIDIPQDIRGTYQYFTEARMDKLRKAGYSAPFHSLEEGISDYVGNYLKTQAYR